MIANAFHDPAPAASSSSHKPPHPIGKKRLSVWVVLCLTELNEPLALFMDLAAAGNSSDRKPLNPSRQRAPTSVDRLTSVGAERLLPLFN